MKSQFITHYRLFCVFSIIIVIVGIIGICIGFWVQFYRPSSPGELMINRSLIAYSFGFMVLAILFWSALKTIKQLDDVIKSQTNV